MENPYLVYRNLVEQGKIKADDIDIDALVEEFLKYSKQLELAGMFVQAGKFVEAVARLFVLKVNSVMSGFEYSQEGSDEVQRERKKYISKKVEEVLKEFDVIKDGELLAMFSAYRRKTGRRPGKVNAVSVRAAEKKTDGFVLIKTVDYTAYAKAVMEKILSGSFRIKSVQDFFGFLFAVYIYSLDIPDEKYREFL